MRTQFKSISVLFLAVLLALFVFSCSMSVDKKSDWSFITSVGGIKVDDPVRAKDGWYIPVQCDVSGLTEITHEPTTLNSALKCTRVSYSTNSDSIFITVHHGAVSLKDGSSQCNGVHIGELEEGQYRVYYKYNNDVHFLRSIQMN